MVSTKHRVEAALPESAVTTVSTGRGGGHGMTGVRAWLDRPHASAHPRPVDARPVPGHGPVSRRLWDKRPARISAAIYKNTQ